jgi:zinc transporter 7
MVYYLIRISKVELVFDVANDFIRPLPQIVQALVSTLFISIVPIFFIYFLNILFLSSPSLKDSVICYLISFAIGGLLGDVFFHTLPHLNSAGSHSHESHNHGAHDHSGHGHSHDPMQMCNNSIIITGIISFFLIEKVVSSVVGHDHSHHSHGEE